MTFSAKTSDVQCNANLLSWLNFLRKLTKLTA